MALVFIWWLCISSSEETRKFDFKVKFDLEVQGQLPLKTIGNLTNLFCISGPNFVFLTWISNELCCGQAQNAVYSDFKLALKVNCPQNNRDLNQGLLHFGPNLVILAWMGPSYRADKQVIDTQTDTHTDTHTQTRVTTIPDDQNWLREKGSKRSLKESNENDMIPLWTNEVDTQQIGLWRSTSSVWDFNHLTHQGLNKMVAILKTTFPNVVFKRNFFFLYSWWCNLQKVYIGSGNGLASHM